MEPSGVQLMPRTSYHGESCAGGVARVCHKAESACAPTIPSQVFFSLQQKPQKFLIMRGLHELENPNSDVTAPGKLCSKDEALCIQYGLRALSILLAMYPPPPNFKLLSIGTSWTKCFRL